MVTMDLSTRRFLHVTNGSSAADTIGAAGIPGVRSIWADSLHDGPVPGGISDRALLEVRARYHAAPSEESFAEQVKGLTEWRHVMERGGYDELVLWFEHDLFDQLNLIELLTWISHRVSSATPVSLICIGTFPGRPDFKGLGELTPGELAPLIDTRRPVSESQYATAERAWLAFRRPTPEALADLVDTGDTSALPFLAPALRRFLQEYPWTSDGLSRTERRFLQLAAGGPVRLAEAFPRMHDGEKAYYVSDTSMADLVEGFSRMSPPLVTWHRDPGGNGQPLTGSVTITPSGEAVLSGREDRVAVYGMDRWMGGVHLQSGTNLWRWDDTRGQVVPDTVRTS
jgi:hypothetical protein